MYKWPDLGYNSCLMAAIRVAPQSPTPDLRRGRRGSNTIVLALAFIVCFLVVDSIVGERGLIALVRAREQHSELGRDVARARAENDELREAIRRLNDDPTALEELARRDQGMIKPGEKLFIIRDVPSPARSH